MEQDDDIRNEIIGRLTQSRTELKQLLDPPPRSEQHAGEQGMDAQGEFPRSRTMRALLSGRGIGTLGALVGGLLIARPGLALRLLRMVPASTVAKMLMAKAVSALKARQQP